MLCYAACSELRGPAGMAARCCVWESTAALLAGGGATARHAIRAIDQKRRGAR